ncbi:hypothetical protein [Streptomyces goshikiensis]
MAKVVDGDLWDAGFFGQLAEPVEGVVGSERSPVGSAEDEPGDRIIRLTS